MVFQIKKSKRNSGNGVLFSSFCAETSLKSSMADIRAKFDSMPGMRVVAYGTHLKYSIIEEGKEAQYLDLDKDMIVFTYYFNEINLNDRALNLMKFLSILAMLDEFYEVKLKSIYHNIIESLRYTTGFGYGSVAGKGHDATAELQADIIRNLNQSNIILSNQLIKANKEKKAVISDVELYRNFCFSIINVLHRRDLNFKEVLSREFEIEKEVMDRVSGLWENNRK